MGMDRRNMDKIDFLNKYIRICKNEIKKIRQTEIKTLEEYVEIFEKQRNEIVLDSQFTWNDKTFKVSDMRWFNDWMYEDCPYTPGFKSYTETLHIFSTDGRSIHFSLPENANGWYDEKHQQFKDFEDFFIDKFGVSFKMVLKKGEVKEQ